MKKFKEICKKIADVLSVIFGYGIAVCLFAGGLTFFGFVAALVLGGAQVNGTYVDKSPSTYTYDNTTQSIVSTVLGESFAFGNEADEDLLTIGTVEKSQEGSYARFYTVDEKNNEKLVEKPEEGVAYKIGISDNKDTVNYLNGEMNEYRMATSTEVSDSIDVYIEADKKDADKYSIYTISLDENGKPEKDDEGNIKKKYINMIYSGGSGYEISKFIKDSIFPVIIIASVSLVLMGLLIMYLRGETALTPDKKKNVKHEGEM